MASPACASPAATLIFMVLLSTLMLPYAVIMIPQYIMFKYLGWIDTYLPLIVPNWFGGGVFNIFLLRQFFRTIPGDLSEAARIDGASELRIYWQIILPLAGPALAVVAIFTFLNTWNDFLGPLIYLSSQTTTPSRSAWRRSRACTPRSGTISWPRRR